MSEQINIRSEALKALTMILEEKRPSHLVIRETLAALPGLDRRDRAFFTRLCEGTVEQLLRIDYVLAQCSSVPVRKMKPLIRTLLRMSVYQLLFMDSVPDSAVCNEAVRLAGKRGFSGLKGYVNGVLRSVCRLDREKTLPPRGKNEHEYLSIYYSAPLWLVDYLAECYGEEKAEKILSGFLAERPLTVRMNLSRGRREDIIGSLENQGVTVKPVFAESTLNPEDSAVSEKTDLRTEKSENGNESTDIFQEALALENPGNPAGLAAMKDGLIQVQDIASMLPVFAADIRPGETVVDVCAAPGGKTLHAADILAGSGNVISRDLSAEKVRMIQENIDRSKLTGITAQVHDATVFDPELEGKADVVIADLPCSGLGIIGKKPDIKYRMDKAQIDELAALQRQILTAVSRYVRPGGRLIFSTCTLSREENQENREWFLNQFPEFKPLPITDGHFSVFGEASVGEGYIQLVPGIHPCDGFFVAGFVRK